MYRRMSVLLLFVLCAMNCSGTGSFRQNPGSNDVTISITGVEMPTGCVSINFRVVIKQGTKVADIDLNVPNMTSTTFSNTRNIDFNQPITIDVEIDSYVGSCSFCRDFKPMGKDNLQMKEEGRGHYSFSLDELEER